MGKIADIIVKYSIKIKDWNKRRAISLFEIEQAENEIIELIEELKPHYRNNHLPEDAEFNKAIKIMEENIAELKGE